MPLRIVSSRPIRYAKVGGGLYHDQPTVHLSHCSPPPRVLHVRANPFFASVDHQLCYPADKESMDASLNHLAVPINGLPFSNRHMPTTYARCSTASATLSLQSSSSLLKLLNGQWGHQHRYLHCVAEHTLNFVWNYRWTDTTQLVCIGVHPLL